MDWLLAHESALQSYALIGTFGLVAIAECAVPLRPAAVSLVQRWFSNISLTVLGSIVTRYGLPFVAIAIAVLAQEHRWGLLNALALPAWCSIVAGVVMLDLAGYGMHRVMHAVPVLWRVHQIHHSDLDLDCGTAIRHHPLEALVSHALTLGAVFALGIAPVAVVISEALQTSASLFNHANIALPARLQALLRHLLVTPDMHRVHHSMVYAESNTNFGNLFPWWDRLLATYCAAPARGQLGIQFGIACAPAAQDVTLLKLLWLPFRATTQIAVVMPESMPFRPGGTQ
ncbi:MAG TPA: sterol desaturase family protein [Burkholderiales bacterium]|nr:sterol desaturase family protein [Burkholderiales bacterium]